MYGCVGMGVNGGVGEGLGTVIVEREGPVVQDRVDQVEVHPMASISTDLLAERFLGDAWGV